MSKAHQKQRIVVITYGTFDLFHIGHLNLLTRLRALGDELHVGVSTDSFNQLKGKKTVISFKDRIEIVRALRCVDDAFPEENWEQKQSDIQHRNASILGMGNDWEGKFDHLKHLCEVVYLPRTDAISTTALKNSLSLFTAEHASQINEAMHILQSIARELSR